MTQSTHSPAVCQVWGPLTCVALLGLARRFPLPLTVAVDDKGELVGGWARRRRGRALTASGAGAGEGTVFLAPWEDAQGQEEEEGREQEAWQSAGAGRWQQAGDGSSSSSSSAGSAGRGVAVRRHLRRLRAESLPPGWWARQRYVEVMPQFWDTSCTAGEWRTARKGRNLARRAASPQRWQSPLRRCTHWCLLADENAIISAEFFHWLKHSESGRQAQLAPSPGNTIFTPAPAHAARLRPKAGPTSRDVPRGEVVPAQEAKGWSFADLQVALPVAQVAKALQDAADVPLLYLGHPVMVVGAGAADAGGDAQLAAAGHDTAPQQGDGGGRAHLPPAAQLLRINGRITRSRCKAVWVSAAHVGRLPRAADPPALPPLTLPLKRPPCTLAALSRPCRTAPTKRTGRCTRTRRRCQAAWWRARRRH